MAENTDVVVTFQKPYGSHFPGEHASFPAEKAAELVASGVALVHIEATAEHAAHMERGGLEQHRQGESTLETLLSGEKIKAEPEAVAPLPIALKELAPTPETEIIEGSPVDRMITGAPVVK